MWGNIVLINQMQQITDAINSNYNVIALTDEVEQFQYTPVLTAGVLLPPYEALSAELDGNYQAAEQIYMEYIFHPDRLNVIATIIAALHMGKNIAIYIPYHESRNFRFVYILCTIFLNSYGICIGDMAGLGMNPVCQYNPDFMLEATRIELMYIFDKIDIHQFSNEFPNNIIPTDNTCHKIASALGMETHNIEELRKWVVGVIATTKRG